MASTLVLCLLAGLLASAGGSGAPQAAADGSLVSLASQGDAVQLWRAATDSAAAAVVAALAKQDSSRSVRLVGTDLEELRIWHGQSVSLGLEADGQPYRWVVQSEPEWRRLAEVLPATQGGLLPTHDWDRLDRDWLSPVSRGSLLPDFVLEGPLDIFLTQPTALQLYLPHASDAGTVQRVLLRQGAAVMVRGARSVRLRRGLDLPAISLSEFADIVTSDAAQRQPLGVMHLLEGVQEAAAAHWNTTHPNESLGLVALEVDLSQRGAALLAAAASGGAAGTGSGRLRVRKLKERVIELVPRDGQAAGAGAAAGEGAVALPSSPAGAAAAAWPLKSVNQQQLQAYERLLRQVISSRLFKTVPPAAGQRQGIRVAHDVQLRLVETEAEATTLLQMQLELERQPKQAGKGAAAVGGGTAKQAAAGGAGRPQQQQQGAAGEGRAADGGAVAAAAAGELPEPPSTESLLSSVGQRLGPFETWEATVQVKRDPVKDTLHFQPLMMQRVGAAHDTVQFAPYSLHSLLGLNNSTDILFA